MRETPKSITAWAHATFGESEDAGQLIARCNEEMAELISEWHSEEREGDIEDLLEEVADVFIVLCQIPAYYGVSFQDIVNSKMSLNRQRTWRVTGKGMGQHDKGE